jgi:hypothetical protein
MGLLIHCISICHPPLSHNKIFSTDPEASEREFYVYYREFREATEFEKQINEEPFGVVTHSFEDATLGTVSLELNTRGQVNITKNSVTTLYGVFTRVDQTGVPTLFFENGEKSGKCASGRSVELNLFEARGASTEAAVYDYDAPDHCHIKLGVSTAEYNWRVFDDQDPTSNYGQGDVVFPPMGSNTVTYDLATMTFPKYSWGAGAKRPVLFGPEGTEWSVSFTQGAWLMFSRWILI